MTWHFDPSGKQMDVYDHTGTKVREAYELGGGWSNGYPDAVEEIMAAEIEANSNMGSGNSPVASEYAVLTIIDYIRGDIKQGTPP
jgi:hypothetical protein